MPFNTRLKGGTCILWMFVWLAEDEFERGSSLLWSEVQLGLKSHRVNDHGEKQWECHSWIPNFVWPLICFSSISQYSKSDIATKWIDISSRSVWSLTYQPYIHILCILNLTRYILHILWFIHDLTRCSDVIPLVLGLHCSSKFRNYSGCV